MKSNFYILGGGGFAKEVYYWFSPYFEKLNLNFKGFISNSIEDFRAHSLKSNWIGNDNLFLQNDFESGLFTIAIGEPKLRKKIALSVPSSLKPLTLIHPTCYISQNSIIGDGSILGPYSCVSNDSEIGKHCVLNFHSIVGHDCKLEDFSVLSPQATMAGSSQVGESCLIGSSATIAPSKKVAKNCKISANVAVLRDVEESTIVFNQFPITGPTK